MKRLGKLIPALAAAACLMVQGCVMVESSVVGGKLGNGTPIDGTATDLGILHLTAPENLTTNAQSNLMANCASGKASGITTELQLRDWFGIVQVYTVTATGTCNS